MIRPRGFGLGPSDGPTPEEIEREAAAELRKALAGSGPRGGQTNFAGANARNVRPEPEPASMPGAQERSTGLTPDDERRAITELAMQQLTERPYGSVRPADTVSSPPPSARSSSPEDMRNRALAEVLEKQRRMARDRPVPPPPENRERPATGQRVSGVSISPRLTVAPTLTASHGPLDEILGRGPAGPPNTIPTGLPGGRGPGAGGRADRHEAGAASPMPRAAARARRKSPQPRRLIDGEAHWKALAELGDLLAEEVYPADAFPEVCRWLADLLESTVAVMLLANDAIDDVVAWPTDDPVVLDLAAVVGQPIDGRSSVWAAVSQGEAMTGDADDPIVMPTGLTADGVQAWAAVPVIDRTVTFGALLVMSQHDDAWPAPVLSLLDAVARRIARALFNCEEAANAGATDNGGTDNPVAENRAPETRGADSRDADNGSLPVAIRDRLGAITLVLGALEELPSPAVAPELDRQYRNFLRQAAELHGGLARFLAGQ